MWISLLFDLEHFRFENTQFGRRKRNFRSGLGRVRRTRVQKNGSKSTRFAEEDDAKRHVVWRKRRVVWRKTTCRLNGTLQLSLLKNDMSFFTLWKTTCRLYSYESALH
uniref:Uncharacterized protein n=1 Tax=Cannabis sativa TaxID=3483 RepID=A0A803R3D0_CANSA